MSLWFVPSGFFRVLAPVFFWFVSTLHFYRPIIIYIQQPPTKKNNTIYCAFLCTSRVFLILITILNKNLRFTGLFSLIAWTNYVALRSKCCSAVMHCTAGTVNASECHNDKVSFSATMQCALMLAVTLCQLKIDASVAANITRNDRN